MRNPIRTSLALVSTCLFLGAASSSWAASIGAQFIGRSAPTDPLLPTESAGLFAQTNWNTIDSGGTFKGTTLSQKSDTGSFTAVKIIYDASDSWNSDGGTATPNEKLMKGIIKANPDPDLTPANNSDRMVFVITNLSPTATYTIIVYSMHNGLGAEMDLTLGATTYYIEEENNFTTIGTFIPATSTTLGLYTDGNYGGFTNVAPAGNGTITITARKHIVDPQIADGIGVAGIQIVQTAGPAFPANTDTCSITANPQSVVAVDGGTATFTVGTQGPCTIQWTKNGVVIPGQINSTLVLPVVLTDNNALIRAVVYNNIITNTSTAATLTVDANTPPVLTQGFMSVNRWENIGGTTGTAGIDDLKAAITARPPDTRFFVPGPNVPDAGIDNYGARVTGWFKPTVTGDYDFFIRSDDSSQLFLNSVNAGSGTNTLPDVNVDAPICQEDGCCDPFKEPGNPETTATPIHLEAGKLYGAVILLKEGGGGDYVQVAWRLTNDTTSAVSLQTIPPLNCWTMASGAGQRAQITSQPQSVTVFEGRTAQFSLSVATQPVAGNYGIAWLANGSAVPRAQGTTYTTPPTTLADSNKQIQAVAFTLPGPLTSSIAVLKVLPDTNPPVALAAAITKSDGTIQVGVSFDEAVNPADVIAGNFSLVGGSGTIRFPTNSYNDYKGILFDTTGLVVGNTYNVHVANVRDLKGNAISGAGVNVPFTVGSIGWADTGTPIRPGQVVPVGADGFDILNGGRQEWTSYDEATIAYLKKTNDFDVKVQVIYAEPGSQWTRVGLQARNDLNVGEPADDRNIATGAGSAYAQTHVNPNQTLAGSLRYDPSGAVPVNPTPNNGHEQNQRLAKGGASSGWGSPATSPVYPNVWLRLQRTGSTLRGFRSEDGVAWIDQGTTTLTDQQPNMFVGPFAAVETGNCWSAADHDVWAGPFDPKYDRLFVYQFRSFGNTFAPTLRISIAGSNVQIVFTGATLQSAPAVTGPWTNVAGATSPYSTPATGAAKFFRARADFP